MRQPNLTDPDFEPTDAELAELMHRAFADVARLRAEAHEKLRAEIAALRRAAQERAPTGSTR